MVLVFVEERKLEQFERDDVLVMLGGIVNLTE